MFGNKMKARANSKSAASGCSTLREVLSYSRQVVRSERGDILVYTAVVAFLLILFAFVYSLQLAIIHAAHVRAQTALDMGVSNGTVVLPGSLRPATLAADIIEGVLTNEVGGTTGRFSDTLAGNSSFRLVVPQYGLGDAALDKWQSYPLAPSSDHPTGVTLTSQLNQFLFGSSLDGVGAVFDPALSSSGSRIDDFGNAMYAYGKFTPFRTIYVSAFAPRVDVAAAASLKPAFVYLLVDTAFSMDEQMARLVWGANQFGDILYDPTHPGQFPIAGVTYTSSETWTYPTQPDPFAGQPYNTSTTYECPGCLSGEISNQTTRIYEFYASLCRTAPFYNYLTANVNLLDAFMKTSAYSSTTMVGIAVEDDIVPVHPVEIISGVARHPSSYNAFYPSPMLQTGTSGEFLHSRKTEAFNGWINTTATAAPAVASSEMPNSGRSLPELGFCRAFATGASEEHFYPVDNFGVVGDSSDLSYASTASRRRGDAVANWASDDTTDPFSINLSKARNTLGGDPARNLLAAQGMRIGNNAYYKLMESGVKWERPDLSAMATAKRSMGPAIEKASDALRGARAAYSRSIVGSQDNPYARFRPIEQRDAYLVISSFGPYSQATFDAAIVANPSLSNEDVHALLKENFLTSLRYALCGRKLSTETALEPVSVVLAFNPYTDFDRTVVSSLADDIRQFALYADSEITGDPTPGSIAACEGTKVAPLSYLFIDYEDMTVDAGTADEEHKRKVLRASYYFMNVFANQVVLPMLRRYMFTY